MKAITSIFQKLSLLLGKEEKHKLFLLFLLTTVGAFLEMIGVSMMVPLISVVMDPGVLAEGGMATQICRVLGITSHKDFILVCILFMIAIFIVKDLFLIFLNYVRAGFVYSSRLEMQKKVFHSIIRRPYEFFLTAESGDIQRLIYNDVEHTYLIVMTLLSLFSDAVVSLALILVIIIIDPLMTAMIAAFLGIILWIILKAIRPKVKEAGIEYQNSSNNVYKWILQMVSGIKEIKVAGHESLFERNFAEAGKQQTEAERVFSVTSGVPKVLVEMGCICSALVVMALMVALGKDPGSLIASFAAFAMAALKLMPSANRILGAANELTFYAGAIDKATDVLQETFAEAEPAQRTDVPVTLNQEVRLSNISFRYRDGNKDILTKASMVIPAGHSVGIVGPSGAGKTTAADILLGLLKPREGQVLADGTDITSNYPAWLDLVAYIPQSIFMMDGSIRDNVLFGEKAPDDEKVWRALEDAQLAEFVRGLPNGLETQIGERGIRLSGGQRQRIGIARALYSDPQLLVFDEATSSLDNETESAIISSINALHGRKTMVIIAHRLQTIENCDIVYRVSGRQIEQVRS